MKNVKLYSHFAIIYNPNSNGDAPAIAKEICKTLSKSVDTKTIIMLPTKAAGHAILLARNAAIDYPHPLIISVSGDGGYNEVINGVIEAIRSQSKCNPVVTVIGAGNANDHYRVVHKQQTISEMITNIPSKIDLLRVTLDEPGKEQQVRYAHSYVGIGLTPLIAEELNRNKLNFFKEIKIMITALYSIRPTRIEHQGKKLLIDSLVFANISQMAKVLTLTDDNSLHDGQFEVIEIKHTTIFGLLVTLIKAATIGLKKQPKSKEYSFSLLEDHPLQIDGEVVSCKQNTRIKVEVARSIISSLR